jgi:hypothetical protein
VDDLFKQSKYEDESDYSNAEYDSDKNTTQKQKGYQGFP